MARIARIVIPQIPHHIVQRGNRCQKVFFNDNDKQMYLELLKEESEKNNFKIWSYCLMDNHVHLIVVPEDKEGLSKGMGETHKKYARAINFRNGWKGHLWQDRFSSFLLDEKYLYSAVKYVERNPVKAGMVESAEEYKWSSAKFRVSNIKNDMLSDFF